MHIHFWGNALNLTGSVEKVLSSFARIDDSEIEVFVASSGETDASCKEDGNYVFFRESVLTNRVLNKWLGLGVFTYPSLIRLIKRYKPDILHFHNRHNLNMQLMVLLPVAQT